MSEYHKIQSVFKRDMKNDRRLIEGEWTLPEFKFLRRNKWQFTEKVDGTNIRVTYADGKVRFDGRTDKASLPSLLYGRLSNIFVPVERMIGEMFDQPVVFYGEGYGDGIQKVGRLYREDQDFVLFDIRVGKWWLERDAVEDIGKRLQLQTVPIIGEGTLYDAVRMVRDGFRSTWGDFTAEGIVARPKAELCTRGGDRIITKIKCKDFYA
jgi:hypothetical protein